MQAVETLTTAARDALLHFVWSGIAAAARHERGPAEQDVSLAMERLPELGAPCGAFVTIYVHRELRGCLGEIDGGSPLLETAVRCAMRVPVADHRFSPLRPDELNSLTFKISILSPMTPVARREDIQVGRDGLCVWHEGRAGLLLPDVPAEYGWDRETFLKHLWLKARIAEDVPFEAAHVEKFTSQIIEGRPAQIKGAGI